MWELREYKTVFSDFYNSECDEDMQAAIDQRLDVLQTKGNLAGEPVSKYLTGTNGLLECRPRAGKQQARLLFFFQPGKKIVFVVAVKKDQRKLSKKDIKKAERRKRLIESNVEHADEVNNIH